MQKKIRYKYTVTVLTLIWMGVIFWFSAQPASESAQMSGTVLSGLQKIFTDVPAFGAALGMGIAEHILRKTAHFLEYALLGTLLYLTVELHISENWKKLHLPIALLSGMLYACTDEWHQFYIPGRSAQWTDVLLDSIGVFVGIMLVKMVLWYLKKKKLLMKIQKK